MKELPTILIHWYDFTKWLFPKVDHFPKKIRFTLSNRILDTSMDILEGMTEACYTHEKLSLLKVIDRKMERLRIMIRLSHDLAFLDHKGYEYASKQINKAGKMLGGWKKQQVLRK